MAKSKFSLNMDSGKAQEKSKVNTLELLSRGAAGRDAPPAPLKVVSLSIHDLVPSKDNFYLDDDTASLKTSIEIFGVKQNLTVKELEGGKYEIIAGHRRRKACIALVNEGKTEFEYVPCAIETIRDELKEQILLITTNSTTRILSDFEKVEQAEKLKECCEAWKERDNLPGRVRDMIADLMNESVTKIACLNVIANNLSGAFKHEFKKGGIGFSVAYELATLKDFDQADAYRQYTENGGLSIKDVKALKEKPPPPPIPEMQALHELRDSLGVVGQPSPPAQEAHQEPPKPPKTKPETWAERHDREMEEMGREIMRELGEPEDMPPEETDNEASDCAMSYCGKCPASSAKCRQAPSTPASITNEEKTEGQTEPPPEVDFEKLSDKEKGIAAIKYMWSLQRKGLDTKIIRYVVDVLSSQTYRED